MAAVQARHVNGRAGEPMERIEAANREAVRRMIDADPVLVDVVPASQAISALGRHTILHAGPPVDWAGMCAMAVLIIVPALILTYLVQKHLIAGLTFGGVKG